jgi:hypothetical protein
MYPNKVVSISISLAVLISIVLSATMVQAIGPTSPDAPSVVANAPIERTYTTTERVKGTGGAPDRFVEVTIVELSQKVTVRAAQPMGMRSGAPLKLDDYTFTMERRLVNTPSGQYRYVAAGGYTESDVTAQELRVAGSHTYGSGQCNNSALNFAGYAYNQTIVDAQQSAIQFGSGLLHCVVSGFHAAKVDNTWPLWVEGQTGPEATF